MYSLVLVDDEEFVLDNICKVFRFEEYGFEMKGAFSRPLRALEKIKEIRPDLIITDISMPMMNGIELAETVRNYLNDTEIVILSGYDDFSYAQTAVRLGISDYLLKPIKKDDFSEMLRKMHDKILHKKQEQESVRQLREDAELTKNELKNNFFLMLAENGHINQKRMEQIYEHLALDFHDSSFVLIKFFFNEMEFSSDMTSELGHLSVELESRLSGYGEVEAFTSDESVYILVSYQDPDVYEDICCAVKEFNRDKEENGMRFGAGVSKAHKNLVSLFTANQECNQMIWASRSKARESLENLAWIQQSSLTIPYDRMEDLFLAVTAGNLARIEGAVENIYSFSKDMNETLALQYSYSISFLILLRLYQLKLKYEINDHIIPEELLELQNLRYQYPSIEAQKSMIEEFSETVSELISGSGVQAPSQIVQAACSHIKEHYCENLSLSSVAHAIGISKNYLCDIFKKETGTTFINYVTNVRIERAKELLRNPELKIYEIGEATGFHDYTYFSQIFKKKTGMTVSAYRKRVHL